MFPPLNLLDSWFYASYQWDLKNQIVDFGPTYYGSRLSWILPGALFHSILPPLVANVCYKLVVSALFSTACAVIVYRSLGLGAAMLAVLSSVLCPQFIVALHTDYIDTPVIVYAALSLACITLAKDSRHWLALIFLGGCFYANMVITNLSALSSLGAGVAIYHLLWLRWGIRRQIICVGVYIAASAATCAVLGLIHQTLGGPFNFLKPQFEMLSYMRALKVNPWMPTDALWYTEATWLTLTIGTLIWGLYCSFIAPPNDARKRLLVRSLTAGLTTSFSLALLLQACGLNPTLSASFYASFHVCLALPLLVTCLASTTRPGPVSTRWLLATLCLLPLLILLWNPRPIFGAVFPFLPFLHSLGATPTFLTTMLLLAAALVVFVRRQFQVRFFSDLLRPELLLLGIFVGSNYIDFHDAATTGRLRERYAAVHAAYHSLASELPHGSYRFWVPADELDGVSLASTKLWGYRLFSHKRFPEFEDKNLVAISENQTVVVPSLPGLGTENLALATRILQAAGYELTAQRIINIPGKSGLGFDLVCFSIHQTPIDPEDALSAPLSAEVILDLDYIAAKPYTLTLAQNIYGPRQGKVIDTSREFPIFTRTDPKDHLATSYQPLKESGSGAERQLTVIATMPADGDCLGVLQIQDYVTAAQISWSQKGRSVHTITIPAGSTSLRLYLQSVTDRPTPLPTHITVYELPLPATSK